MLLAAYGHHVASSGQDYIVSPQARESEGTVAEHEPNWLIAGRIGWNHYGLIVAKESLSTVSDIEVACDDVAHLDWRLKSQIDGVSVPRFRDTCSLI